jgi:hypothetical protein
MVGRAGWGAQSPVTAVQAERAVRVGPVGPAVAVWTEMQVGPLVLAARLVPAVAMGAMVVPAVMAGPVARRVVQARPELPVMVARLALVAPGGTPVTVVT